MALLRGVDPIIAHYNRHALGALSLTAIIFALALYEAHKWKPIIVWAFASFLFLGTLSRSIGNIGGLGDSADFYDKRSASRVQLANWLNSQGIKTYAIGDAGIVPFLTPESFVYDYYGLNSRKRTTYAIADDRPGYLDWLLAERPEAVIIVSTTPLIFKPRNATQRFLAETFTEVRGYHDEGISFGEPKDRFHYRILRTRN